MNLCEREETKLREVSGKFRVAKVNIQSPRRLSDGQWPIYPADWATKTKAVASAATAVVAAAAAVGLVKGGYQLTGSP